MTTVQPQAAYRSGMAITDRMRMLAQRRPHSDIAVAAVVYAVTLVTTAAGPAGGKLDAIGLVTAGLACGALAFRGRFPFWVLATSAASAEAYLFHLQGGQGTVVLAAPLIALYTVAETTTRRRALIVGVLAVLAFGGLHTLGRPASWLGAENLALAAFGGLAVAAGDASRSRRAYLAEVEARALHAETDREAEAARRVTEERLRIARDLHDAIGHHLALIHVQAGVADHVLGSAPAQAREALGHIRSASKLALGELGETVGLLRQPGELAAPTQPVAGLAGIDDLMDTFRRSGLTIAEHVDGPIRSVTVAVDLTAYRVIQESLTNVCKHAGSTTVEVRLLYAADSLRIIIDNQAALPRVDAARHSPTTGHGVAGMRERVTALGGTLRAGLRPDGGYRVSAVLPLAETSPA